MRFSGRHKLPILRVTATVILGCAVVAMNLPKKDDGPQTAQILNFIKTSPEETAAGLKASMTSPGEPGSNREKSVAPSTIFSGVHAHTTPIKEAKPNEIFPGRFGDKDSAFYAKP